MLTGAAWVTLFWVYLYLVHTGAISRILNAVGVNMMGRDYIWSLAKPYYQFSPTFIGLGFEAVDAWSPAFMRSASLMWLPAAQRYPQGVRGTGLSGAVLLVCVPVPDPALVLDQALWCRGRHPVFCHPQPAVHDLPHRQHGLLFLVYHGSAHDPAGGLLLCKADEGPCRPKTDMAAALGAGGAAAHPGTVPGERTFFMIHILQSVSNMDRGASSRC